MLSIPEHRQSCMDNVRTQNEFADAIRIYPHEYVIGMFRTCPVRNSHLIREFMVDKSCSF